jgi:hypothetical protein
MLGGFAVTCGLASLSYTTQAASLVVNGGFDTGTFDGWTQSGLAPFSGVACTGATVDGSCFAFLGPVGTDGTLSQSISTQAGVSYLLTFGAAFDGTTPTDFSVKWGSQTLYSVINPAATTTAFQTFTFNLAATGSSTLLSFSARSDLGEVLLDGVSVSPVPEPSTMALLALGLGLVGAAAARRRHF